MNKADIVPSFRHLLVRPVSQGEGDVCGKLVLLSRVRGAHRESEPPLKGQSEHLETI